MKRILFGATSVLIAAFAVAWSLPSPQAAPADNTEVAWQSRDEEHLMNLYSVGGRPRNLDSGHKVKVLVNHGFAVGYSEERRNPLWAVYKASGLVGNDDNTERFERSNFFSPDIRATPSVDGRTFGGGMDRGHMVPNAAIATQYGSLSQMETFYMTNMSPQAADLNRGPWQRLEHWIPEAAEEREHVFVICGPIFGATPGVVQNGADRGIQVPEAFYMILVDAENEHREPPTVRLLAYRFPQTTARNADFRDRAQFGVSVNDIETATRLDFFPEFEVRMNNWDDREDEVVGTHWTPN